VNPLTFLPPRRLEVARVPLTGERARELPLPVEPGRAAVVTFLRHTGCPFAERTLQLMRQAAARAPELQWLAVSHAPGRATERWLHAVGGAGAVTIVSDPARGSYAAWGLGRTSASHFLGRQSLAAVAGLARAGIRNRHPHGSRWQGAGTFALDGESVVRWRHLPAHAGDLPDLHEAQRALA
jgi:hypothetical protein